MRESVTIAEKFAALDGGWSVSGERASKTYRFPSFAAAIGFMVEVAIYADKLDHHPEWKNIYNQVWVELTTHDSKSLTEKDLLLATYMEKSFGK